LLLVRFRSDRIGRLLGSGLRGRIRSGLRVSGTFRLRGGRGVALLEDGFRLLDLLLKLLW